MKPASSPITVAAAVIERDGRILICRRRAGDRHGLKWEFPGGKVELGESPERALGRELEEELGIKPESFEEMERYVYEYPDGLQVRLIFYRVRKFTGEPRNLAFEEIRWERSERLPEYDFLEGDADFVQRLAQSSGRV
ncbi:MAG: 8-oxo-dGTP diphosphatase MutT [Bryobacterales bacterium]|nr:8-oxo-dGTP diphosphatase MutT [Bryobacterales bacterium]